MNAVGYLIGAGSFSIGVEQAGYTIENVFETPGYSKNATSWDMNRPDNKHSVVELHRDNKIPISSGVDLLYGNPPCGGLSNITGCHLGSKTNSCMVEWLHMAVKARPRMILMENAYQLATTSGSPLLHELKGILTDAGYNAWTWLFHSWQLGCPQSRRRMFLCGSIDKLANPELISVDDLPKDWGNMTVMQWLWDLENILPSLTPVKTSQGHSVTQHWWDNTGRQVSEYLPRYFDIATNLNFMSPKQAEKWRDSKIAKERKDYEKRMAEGLFWEDCPAVFQGMQQFRRPHKTPLFGPSQTVLSDFRLVHPTVPRLLTMREQARLMGYPDSWDFHKCRADLTAQGIPTFNAKWAARRILETVGLYQGFPTTQPSTLEVREDQLGVSLLDSGQGVLTL